MIYVISGMVRAGTSMVAEALKQGGIPLLHDPKLVNTDPTDDFPHNAFDINEQMRRAVKPEELDGYAIKLMASPLMAIPKTARQDVKVIWMYRKARCVLMSLQHADAMRGIVRDRGTNREARAVERFWRKRAIESGFDLFPLRYEKMVKNPRKWTRKLLAFLGQPPNFDIEKAIAVVDPKKWRQR